MKDSDSKYYVKAVPKFKLKQHKTRTYKHTKRIESNIESAYHWDTPTLCAHSHLNHAAITRSSNKIDVEARCHKCGWKILYSEAYKNTEMGWGKHDYYYHLRCYSK